jgi:carbonic anhydrase/acetyltransferase-like protein (isoleucine patch superfamily)
MALYALGTKTPRIGANTWIAPSAEVVGDVTIGGSCWIGPCAVIRGDFGTIVIGDCTAVEDAAVIHTPSSVVIGSFVTIGHLAMVHGASIGDYAVVGMNSTLGDNTRVGEWSIVAEHALVKKNQSVPPGRIYAGVPAVDKGEVTALHREVMLAGKELYRDLAGRYIEGLRRVG